MDIDFLSCGDIFLGNFNFCSFKHFFIDNFSENKDIITEYINSRYYRKTYIYENEKIHGPFIIEKIAYNNYIKIDTDTFLNTSNKILENHGAMSDEECIKTYNFLLITF
jgi:hypothetical protein